MGSSWRGRQKLGAESGDERSGVMVRVIMAGGEVIVGMGGGSRREGRCGRKRRAGCGWEKSIVGVRANS